MMLSASAPTAKMPLEARPKAVLFDLLTALMDSWTLWDSVAENLEDGRRWRAKYLKITYAEGRYRPYEILVREAALAVGLSADLGKKQPGGLPKRVHFLLERCVSP